MILSILPQASGVGTSPHTPISHLVSLVRFEGSVMMQEICKAMLGIPQKPRSMVSVEQANDVKAKIALQPHDITGRSMQDLCLSVKR